MWKKKISIQISVLLLLIILLMPSVFSIQANLTDGLDGCHSLDDSTVSGDTASNSVTGSTQGDLAIGTATITGKSCLINECFNFTNTKAATVMSRNNLATSGTDARAACWWVRMTTESDADNAIAFGDFSGANTNMVWSNNGANSERISDGTESYDTGEQPQTAAWQQNCMSVSDGSSAGLTFAYKNGAAASTPSSGLIFYTNLPAHNLTIGDCHSTCNSPFNGAIDEVFIWNRGITLADVQDHYNSGAGLGCVALFPSADLTPPSFSNDDVNNTLPKENDTININITITEAVNNISGYIFSWDNGTGIFKNDSFVNLITEGIKIVNVSVNKTIEVPEGTIIKYQWWANDTLGNMGNSSIFSFTVAGTTSPNVTIHGSNFFASDNSTIISLNQAASARLNFSFIDNIDLFGFVINITFDGNLIFDLTNLTLNGTIDNFTKLINVQGPQGTYRVNITVADTHTAKIIPDYDIRKGFSWLEYNGKIRIEAEGAIWASTKKYYDRYDFRFTYLPLIGPKNKVFYIESDGPLIYQEDSQFKAHFVDYKNKKWIDFEGLEGDPIITKINDRRWKIEFTNSDSKVIFNSIGGLNEDSFIFEYYLSNVSVSFFEPKVSPKTFIGTSLSVSLNVTGNGRNETRFRLYNSSKELIGSANISATGDGTFFYNTTFNGLSGTQFFVNATHIDINGETTNSTTIIFDSIQVEDCTNGFPAINFTLRDELNSSKVKGDSATVFDYNGTVKNFQFTKTFTNQDNFSICIFPARETIIADYQITYEASGFPQRVATVSDITLNNITKLTNLLLLRTVDGIFATFRIIDSFQNPLSGVTASFAKAGVTIETRLTDDAGIVSFFVNPDTTYVFTFTKTGFRTSTNSLRITTGDIITITLESEVEEQVASFATGISYFFYPQNQMLNNDTDFNFRFNLTSTFWNITGCTLRLKNASEELAQGNCQFNKSQSNVSIIFNTGNQSIIIAEAEWEINGTFNSTAIYSYRVENVFVGASSLKNFLDDISSFSEAGFNDFNRFLIAILIILFVVGGLSLKSTDFREPEILIPVTWLMVAFFSYLGWMNIPLDTIPQVRGLPEDWLNRWNVFILTSLLGGAYLIRKHTK